MSGQEFKKVLILGAGTMGHQIGFLCATHGLDVAVYDISEESLTTAQEKVQKLARRFVRMGKISQEGADGAVDRMSFTCNPEAAAEGADIISESVTEVPELKGRVFAQFNEICPEHVIFTTNTSTLLPSQFAGATGRPERFAALHFHDVSFNNVVDIMPHPGTAPETIDGVKDFTDQIEQVAIVLKKESPGYVFNAILTEWLRAAQSLAAKGVAEPKDVDRAWMGVMGVHTGPFAIMDSIGLDTCYHITNYWAQQDSDPRLKENAAYLKDYVDRGELGAKSGKGFYTYPGPDFLNPDFLKGHK